MVLASVYTNVSQTLPLPGLIDVVATVTVTDGDNDTIAKQSTSSALSLTFDDTNPTLTIDTPVSVAAAEVVEASGIGGTATIPAPAFTATAVDGFTTDTSYKLALVGPTASGLQTTDGNHAITLVADSDSQISGKYDSDGNASLYATAFTVTLSGNTVTLTSLVALEHDNTNVSQTLSLAGLIDVVATVTVTDGDNDTIAKQSTSSALSLTFDDTNPTLTIDTPVSVAPA